jgi:WD40 repeat protein
MLTRILACAAIALVLLAPATAQAERPIITPANAQELVELRVYSAPDAFNDADFRWDSRYIAAVSDDTALRVWDIEAEGDTPLYEGFEHFSFVKTVGWLENTIVTGSWDRTMVVWDVTEDIGITPRLVTATYDAVIDAMGTTGSRDSGSVFIGVGDGTVRLYDGITNSVSGEWAVPALRVTAIAVSPDVRSMAAAGGFPSTGAQVWDIASASNIENPPEPTVLAHPGTVLAIDYITASSVALGGDDGTVTLWQFGQDDPIATLQQIDWVVDLDVSPDGTLLAVARQDGVMTLWDITTPAQAELIVAVVASTEHPLTALTFSPDGRTLATTDSGGALRVWGVVP